MKKILFAGESWMSHTTHVKGFDTFFTSVYESGEKFLKAALEEAGYEVYEPTADEEAEMFALDELPPDADT